MRCHNLLSMIIVRALLSNQHNKGQFLNTMEIEKVEQISSLNIKKRRNVYNYFLST